MRHIAIVEQLHGKTVEWMERVSDEEILLVDRIRSATRSKQVHQNEKAS